jgi:dUTP pyrophosphatase
VFVGLYNTSAHTRQIQIGDRIAQLLIQKVWTPELNTVDALSPSERESRGFGSSGI